MTEIIKTDYEPVTATSQPIGIAVAIASRVTISSATWTTPDQAVASMGESMDAGDAGELAVRRFGKTLKKLADN